MLYTKTMPSYCLKFRKNTENIHSKVVRTKNSRILRLSKSSVCNSNWMEMSSRTSS